jgi:hypothetical protein
MRNRNEHRSSLSTSIESGDKKREMKPSQVRISMGLFLLATFVGGVPAAQAHGCSTQRQRETRVSVPMVITAEAKRTFTDQFGLTKQSGATSNRAKPREQI